MRVGIAGLGKMGGAMARRLRESGFEIAVWNRTRDKADQMDCAVANTPRDLAGQVDVVVSMLFDGDAVEAVYRGPDGVLEADFAGKLAIEMSTVRPHVQQALAADIAARGGHFVDCPVSGTVGPAREGKLLGLAGGDDASFAMARPVLDALCRQVEHLGPAGAGASMKLAVNLPLLVFWQSFGEAMAMVRHLNLDPAWLVQFFAATSGGPNVLKSRAEPLAKALAGGDPGATSFDIDSIRKDLRTMLEEAASRGFTVPVAAQALASFDGAAADGLGGSDCTLLPARWAKADH